VNYKVGEVYDIRHSRKGNFKMRVTEQCDEWLDGIIVEGVADAMMEYNKKGVGDELRLNKTLIKGHTHMEANKQHE